MAKSNFIVRGGADFSAIPKELQKLQGKFNGFSKSLNAGLKIAVLGKIAQKGFEFGKEAIQVASDLQEVQNVVDVTFGSMSSEVNNFADNALKQFGLSELSAKKFTSTMGAMLKSSGLSGAQAKDMSIEVAKLTADMASFYNLDHDEAFTKIQSGLSGETEPLKRLGINMNVANMEAYAMSQGINKAWREMTQAEQTMLRYNYLLSVTGDAQGDFARTSGSWANQIKLLKEQWKEFMGLIGQALTKVLLPIVQALNKMLEFLINITKEIGKIYTLVTGKEIAVESNNSISDTAMDAAAGEEELADGIGKAASAAKKAMASFDELNILQSGLGESGSSGLPGTASVGGLNTSITTTKVDNGFNEAREEGEKYFIWFENRWRSLRQTLEIPIRVPAPVFSTLPNPIYKPSWGLTPPLVPAPAFAELPDPVYEPSWNIAESLARETQLAKQTFSQWVLGMEQEFGYLQNGMSAQARAISTDIQVNFGEFQTQTQTQMQKWKEGVTTETTETSKNVDTNTNILTQSILKNFGAWQTGSKYGMEMWKVDTTGKMLTASDNMLQNFNAFLDGSNLNLANWANSTGRDYVTWGNGMTKASHSTAYNMAGEIIGGLKVAFQKFKESAAAMGQKVFGNFSGSFAIPSMGAIGLGVLGTLGTTLKLNRGGFAPALANGAVIPPNNEFLAILGDQTSGRNIETPESLLRQIYREESNNTQVVYVLQDILTAIKEGKILAVDKQVLAKVVNKAQSNSFKIAGSTTIPI